ncbi:MAG TPA: DUF4870 domain-containing protein [Pyrinomonadaceae bacterium]|jgi:uncharacterized membrane protein|nr:DUF4870 domain-containing protein [Pyrinomonadaceae bacterium]
MSAPYEAGGPPSGAPGGKTSLGLESNVGAMLCYIANIICCLGVILAVIFLVTEKENRFVKFHAVQSLFLVGVQLVVGIAVGIVGLLFRMALSTADLGLIAVLLVFGLRIILLLIFLAIWIFAGMKAYGGQWYKLPLIGNLAWNTVNK